MLESNMVLILFMDYVTQEILPPLFPHFNFVFW